jgi:acyl-CoA thioester hydrolase
MFSMTLSPRFYETDAFGHINNTVINGWFETAREPIFRIFNPEMNIKSLPLILARTEVDFVAQAYYGKLVEIKTGIERVGTSSFVVTHEAWQGDICVARGKAVQVYFDFSTQKSAPIPEHERSALSNLIKPTHANSSQ